MINKSSRDEKRMALKKLSAFKKSFYLSTPTRTETKEEFKIEILR